MTEQTYGDAADDATGTSDTASDATGESQVEDASTHASDAASDGGSSVEQSDDDLAAPVVSEPASEATSTDEPPF